MHGETITLGVNLPTTPDHGYLEMIMNNKEIVYSYNLHTHLKIMKDGIGREILVGPQPQKGSLPRAVFAGLSTYEQQMMEGDIWHALFSCAAFANTQRSDQKTIKEVFPMLLGNQET